jgi:predicted transcriptional regulator
MAGRPHQFDEATLVRHTPVWRKAVDRLAKRLKVSRAEVIRQATSRYLETEAQNGGPK